MPRKLLGPRRVQCGRRHVRVRPRLALPAHAHEVDRREERRADAAGGHAGGGAQGERLGCGRGVDGAPDPPLRLRVRAAPEARVRQRAQLRRAEAEAEQSMLGIMPEEWIPWGITTELASEASNRHQTFIIKGAAVLAVGVMGKAP